MQDPQLYTALFFCFKDSATVFANKLLRNIRQKILFAYIVIIPSFSTDQRFQKRSVQYFFWSQNAWSTYTKAKSLDFQSYSPLLSNFYFFTLQIKYLIWNWPSYIVYSKDIVSDFLKTSYQLFILHGFFFFGPKVLSIY